MKYRDFQIKKTTRLTDDGRERFCKKHGWMIIDQFYIGKATPHDCETPCVIFTCKKCVKESNRKSKLKDHRKNKEELNQAISALDKRKEEIRLRQLQESEDE